MPTDLFFRSNYELSTLYISTYCQALVDLAVSKGHNVVDLLGPFATEENLVKSIEQYVPQFCYMLGHGKANSFFGDQDQTVLMACINDDILKGTTSAFVSCSTGIALGPSIVQKDGLGYIGYQADFIFIVDDSLPVLEDPYARSFMESAMTPIKVLVNGGTLWEAYNETIRKFNQEIARWRGSADPVADEIVKYLYFDRDNLIAITEGFIVPVRVGKTAPLILLPFALLALVAIQ